MAVLDGTIGETKLDQTVIFGDCWKAAASIDSDKPHKSMSLGDDTGRKNRQCQGHFTPNSIVIVSAIFATLEFNRVLP